MGQHLLILGYHNLRGAHCFSFTGDAGIRGLQAQLRWMCRAGSPLPLGEALAHLDAGEELPPRAFSVTFDDGYRDNLTPGVEVLDRMGVPATIFLVPGLLSREVRSWWEQTGWAFDNATSRVLRWEGDVYDLGTYESRRHAYGVVSELLKRRDRHARELAVEELEELLAPAGEPDDDDLFLDWDGAREIANHFDVGSHSMYHTILTEETPEVQRADLAGSRLLLERKLGKEVSVLAYPNGTRRDFDAVTEGAAQEAGYAHAVTTIAGRNSPRTLPYRLRRFVMYPERGTFGLSTLPLETYREFRDQHA